MTSRPGYKTPFSGSGYSGYPPGVVPGMRKCRITRHSGFIFKTAVMKSVCSLQLGGCLLTGACSATIVSTSMLACMRCWSVERRTCPCRGPRIASPCRLNTQRPQDSARRCSIDRGNRTRSRKQNTTYFDAHEAVLLCSHKDRLVSAAAHSSWLATSRKVGLEPTDV